MVLFQEKHEEKEMPQKSEETKVTAKEEDTQSQIMLFCCDAGVSQRRLRISNPNKDKHPKEYFSTLKFPEDPGVG
jgi:hypothetical protein